MRARCYLQDSCLSQACYLYSTAALRSESTRYAELLAYHQAVLAVVGFAALLVQMPPRSFLALGGTALVMVCVTEGYDYDLAPTTKPDAVVDFVYELAEVGVFLVVFFLGVREMDRLERRDFTMRAATN